MSSFFRDSYRALSSAEGAEDSAMKNWREAWNDVWCYLGPGRVRVGLFIAYHDGLCTTAG
jgi:hypothetical protein